MQDIYESTGGLGATVSDADILPVPTSGPPGGRPPGPLSLPSTTTTTMLPPVQQSMAQPAYSALPPPPNVHASFTPVAQDTKWTPSQPVGGEWWHWLMYAGVGAVCGWAMAPSADERMKWCAIGAAAGGIGQGIGLGVAGYFALREKDGD